MSKIKKAFAILLSMAMILGMSLTVFANDDTSKTEASVKGLESDRLTVTAYQIISYDEAGYYEPVLPDSITTDGKTEDNQHDILTPTADDVQKLAARTDELTTTVTEWSKTEKQDETYTYSSNALTAGTWMIIVSGSEKYLYNPAIISVNVTADGTEYGTLNLVTDSWDHELYPKRSEPTITKTAEKADTKDTEVVGVQHGDIIKFTVTSDIPDYSSDVTSIDTYIISDQLDGLSLVKNDQYPVTVTVDGAEDISAIKNTIINAVMDGESTFSAVLSEADTFLLANGGKQIVITYYAKVTSIDKINVDELNNTAKLEYSTRDKTITKDDSTKHYTFGFDTGFNGSFTSDNKTGEFFKIDEKGNVNYEEKNSGKVTVTSPLFGAKFELRIGSKTGEVFGTYTTDSDGRLEVNGLDPDVTYYLVETKAPSGYTLNTTPIKVEIEADFTGDTLTGYDVIFNDGKTTATTHYGYEEGETIIINTEDTPSNPYGFKNTTLNNLPSTGGMGTTIFTIGGCVIMIAAAGLYFASRRRQESK